jgi:prolyl oligopeptidase PreP (S9A serine peptidase family)
LPGWSAAACWPTSTRAGSGAYGDDWHRAGFKTTKPNTWKDGIAAAQQRAAAGMPFFQGRSTG